MIGLRIDPAAAKAKLDAGEAVPLDVTSSLVYPAVNNRIVRALQAARPAADNVKYFDSLPPDKEIVAYCT